MKLTWFIKIIHHQSNPSFRSDLFNVFAFVCMGKPTSELENERKSQAHGEKNRDFFSFFINYVDLSWPIEILIGLFEYECVQCTQCIRACMKMTEHIHLNILPPHLWFDTTSTHSALLLHQYVSFAHFILLDYRYACCIFISFRFVCTNLCTRQTARTQLTIMCVK